MSVLTNFFATLYESLVYIPDFSDALYHSGGYVTIGLIMIFSSLVLEAFYYYFLSSYGSLFKRIYWFVWLLFIAIINFWVAFYYSDELVYSEPLPDITFIDYNLFLIVNAFWSVIFSFVFSLILKTKSIKGSRTPF